MSSSEVIMESEEDAYKKLADGIAISNLVKNKKGEIDEWEASKGGGFPAIRALAVFCLAENRGDRQAAMKQFELMEGAVTGKFLSDNYTKSDENFDKIKGRWKVRTLLPTWASAKSVVLKGLEGGVDIQTGSGKSWIEKQTKLAKKRAEAAAKAAADPSTRRQKVWEEILSMLDGRDINAVPPTYREREATNEIRKLVRWMVDADFEEVVKNIIH